MTYPQASQHNASLLQRYQALHDGLSDMIEQGRLREEDIPEDYRWLVESLETLAVQEGHDVLEASGVQTWP